MIWEFVIVAMLQIIGYNWLHASEAIVECLKLQHFSSCYLIVHLFSILSCSTNVPIRKRSWRQLLSRWCGLFCQNLISLLRVSRVAMTVIWDSGAQNHLLTWMRSGHVSNVSILHFNSFLWLDSWLILLYDIWTQLSFFLIYLGRMTISFLSILHMKVFEHFLSFLFYSGICRVGGGDGREVGSWSLIRGVISLFS